MLTITLMTWTTSPTTIAPGFVAWVWGVCLTGTIVSASFAPFRAAPPMVTPSRAGCGERTDGVLTIEDAALYQALHRLEARGWIEAEWGLSENNRKAKYYALSAAGRQQVRSEISIWKKYAQAVFKVIEPI